MLNPSRVHAQVETLRCDIRRREWEDAAKKALNGKSSLTALQEALSDAPTMAAGDSPLLTALRCCCASPDTKLLHGSRANQMQSPTLWRKICMKMQAAVAAALCNVDWRVS